MWSVPERSALQKHLSLYSCYNLQWLQPSVLQHIWTNEMTLPYKKNLFLSLSYALILTMSLWLWSISKRFITSLYSWQSTALLINYKKNTAIKRDLALTNHLTQTRNICNHQENLIMNLNKFSHLLCLWGVLTPGETQNQRLAGLCAIQKWNEDVVYS